MKKKLEKALYYWNIRETLDTRRRAKAIHSLSNDDLWSLSQISGILGVTPRAIGHHVRRAEKSGGAFVPETLGDIIELHEQHLSNSVDDSLIVRVIGMGTGLTMLERLTGIGNAELRRRLRHGRKRLQPVEVG